MSRGKIIEIILEVIIMSVVSMNVPEEVLLDIHKDKNEFMEELSNA